MVDATPTNTIGSGRELVFMTHGIASTRWLLTPLAWRLRQEGFTTRLYGYPSIWWSNRSHGKKLAKVLRRVAPEYDRVHLVVHSMGSIVTRCALEEQLPENLGRVVMIAPPNRGSHRATTLAWSHGWVVPTLLEIQDTHDSFVNRELGPLPEHADVGVLAASHDDVLYPEQTHVDGQSDHYTVTGWHTGVLWKRETARRTARFLREGRFADADQADTVQADSAQAATA